MSDIITLEKLLEKYPWYSLAHLELYRQMSARGEEHRKAYLKIVASHMYSRAKLYVPTHYEEPKPETPRIVIPDSEFSFELEDDTPIDVPQPEKRVFISGGDYFSRSDFANLDLRNEDAIDRFILEKPSISKAGEVQGEGSEITGADIFEDINFYTETLARIYAEQGFYKRAIEVYAKLILLYPEKSSYFATLVQELKNINNN